MERRTAPAAGGRVALLLILLLAAFLRLLSIDAGWFGVDQARDLAWAASIASGEELPRVGPLMRGRVHLGATYYYLWSLPAFVGSDPRIAYAFAAVLGVAAVAATHTLGSWVAGETAGLLAALLLATDPSAVIDSRIAWAPALIPPLAAAVLLLCHTVLYRPRAARAAATAAAATLATQLHLATAPLLFVAAGSVLARARALGRRGLAAAALAALVPLAPMAVAWRLDAGAAGPVAGDVRPSSDRPPAPLAAASTAATRSPKDGRVGDLLLISGRTIDGYSPPRGERTWLLSIWALCERFALSVAIAGALLVAFRAFREPSDRLSPLPELAAFALAIGAVALLPGEAWYYYLDTALVPGCVLLGAAATAQGKPATLLRAVLIAAVALRVAGLLVWLERGPATGLVRANLEWLRLGGSDETQLAGRARLPTLAVKQAAADAIVGELGIGPEDVRRRVHGAAFGDLDTDNGFFFARAARHDRDPRDPRADQHALAVYADELPVPWVARFGPPLRAGPLAIYTYSPALQTGLARIRDCGGAALPSPRTVDPRDYGFGLPELPAWPCSPGEVEVDIPIAALPKDTAVRAFARVQGDARVVSLESEPPGNPVAAAPPGSGAGIELPGDARRSG